MENLVIASDHAAYELKEQLKIKLVANGYQLVDLGCHSKDSVHYPDIAKELAQYVLKHKCKGILLCGSGIGVSITANRYPGIYAALVTSVEMAEMSRRHNHANVLIMGSRFISPELAEQILDKWLNTEPELGRHEQRVAMIDG
ncbi:MAG: ribose 5-phosphate isomerase B [Cyanobacteria bacterium]|nr:ribose 5-phosphate isomerase B [Cyanobacteriota bacterium]MDA1021179.1 ribose 5-phosphate isomerase B [Cyanobacteriota bacterium]